MKKIFKKCLSLMLCAILVMGTAAAGGDGFLKSHDSFTVRANAASNPYPTSQTFEYNGRWYTMKRTAGRPSNNSCQVGTNFRTDKEIAENSEDSARQIQRYIRLTNLIPELLKLMDEGKIAFSVGVELSYLDEEKQYTVLGQIEELDCTPSYAQANHMHKDFLSGTLSNDSIAEMMYADKPNQKPVYKVSAERLSQFIRPDTPPKQAEEFIIKACDHYAKFLKRQRNRDAR